MAASLPSDTDLSERGLAPTGQGRVLLIACGALAHEIVALKKINGWDHLDLTCLPAKYHLFPDKITEAVSDAVAKHRAHYQTMFVAYADCGTGGLLKARCDDLGVEMIAGPHCYAFFEGVDAFVAKADEEFTAFYLTDFLVRQFDAFIWKPMGLDRHPELLEMYFGNYTKLVFQAQTDNPELDKKAAEIAARMKLPLERRFTGYGDLRSSLARLSVPN